MWFIYFLYVSLFCRINTSKKEVLENLQKLWETFLKSTESSVADFLSVEHTAIILDNLAQTGIKQKIRTWCVGQCWQSVDTRVVRSFGVKYLTLSKLKPVFV